MITRKTFINSDKVRNFCIENQYYTKGDSIAYKHLLFDLCKYRNITDDDLKEIAIDIVSHSNFNFESESFENEENVFISDMMTKLFNECCYTFYTALD